MKTETSYDHIWFTQQQLRLFSSPVKSLISALNMKTPQNCTGVKCMIVAIDLFKE